MTKIISLLFFVMIAGGSDAKPPAKLTYGSLYQAPPHIFVIEFDSNLNMEELYPKTQHIVGKELVCALGTDQDFSVGHYMQYDYRGQLKMRESSQSGQNRTFHYLAKGGFYKNSPDGSESRLMNIRELSDVLGSKKSVSCKARMSVYPTSPYFSEMMSIPTEDILAAYNAEAIIPPQQVLLQIISTHP